MRTDEALVIRAGWFFSSNTVELAHSVASISIGDERMPKQYDFLDPFGEVKDRG